MGTLAVGDLKGGASRRVVDVTFVVLLLAQPPSQIKSSQLVCHLQIMWLLTGHCVTSPAGEKRKVRQTGFDYRRYGKRNHSE